jgi:hypothetical protein
MKQCGVESAQWAAMLPGVLKAGEFVNESGEFQRSCEVNS